MDVRAAPVLTNRNIYERPLASPNNLSARPPQRPGNFSWRGCIGAERKSIRAGSPITSPAGGEPHQIVNTSQAELRYLAFSTIGEVDLLEYPYSAKVAGAAGIKNADFKTASIKFLARPDSELGYFDGEEPPKD